MIEINQIVVPNKQTTQHKQHKQHKTNNTNKHNTNNTTQTTQNKQNKQHKQTQHNTFIWWLWLVSVQMAVKRERDIEIDPITQRERQPFAQHQATISTTQQLTHPLQTNEFSNEVEQVLNVGLGLGLGLIGGWWLVD